jgi:hypothetical protein
LILLETLASAAQKKALRIRTARLFRHQNELETLAAETIKTTRRQNLQGRAGMLSLG